ncbi:hypothetical protein [Kribbella sp. NPDC055071]
MPKSLGAAAATPVMGLQLFSTSPASLDSSQNSLPACEVKPSYVAECATQRS